MKKVVAIGDITIDQSYILDGFVQEDFKHSSSGVVHSVGGPSAIAALFLSRMRIKTVLYGSLGRDLYGKKAKNVLEKSGVTLIENIQRKTKLNTYIINKSNSSRTGIKSSVVYKKPARISHKDVKTADAFIFDRNNYSAFLYTAKKRNKKSIVVVDTSVEISDKAMDMLKKSTHPVISIEAVKRFDERQDWTENGRMLYDILDKDFVVTAGKYGSYVFSRKEIRHIQALKSVRAVDTLGAGDVFRGAFVYAYLAGLDIDGMCKFANFASALHCSKFGNSTALPEFDVLDKYMKNNVLDSLKVKVL